MRRGIQFEQADNAVLNISFHTCWDAIYCSCLFPRTRKVIVPRRTQNRFVSLSPSDHDISFSGDFTDLGNRQSEFPQPPDSIRRNRKEKLVVLPARQGIV